MDRRSWTDEDLIRAVAISTSWSGVLRELGLRSMSSESAAVAKRHAKRLGLDTIHINGNIKYSWPVSVLKQALDDATDWPTVAERLGFEDTPKFRLQVRGYARRVGVDFEHLDNVAPVRESVDFEVGEINIRETLRVAAPTLATGWFTLHGFEVATPQEPTHYDLLVTISGRIARVQVKSTAYKPKGKWLAGIGRRPYSLDKTAAKAPYDPDSLDYFLIIDGDGSIYLIPTIVVAGMMTIQLSAYEQYIIGSVSSLIQGAA